jgi:hypothetical protein
MADLSGLKLKKREATNWDDYPQGGGGNFGKLLPPGEYVGVAPSSFKFDANDGNLVALMELVKILNVEEGYSDEIRYERLNTKPYSKGKRKGACRAGDYLLSVGSEDRPGTDPQEWADAIEATADGQFEFVLDWECYDSETEKQVADSYTDFPVDPANPTERLPYITVKRPDGNEVRLRGRQKIRFYKFSAAAAE